MKHLSLICTFILVILCFNAHVALSKSLEFDIDSDDDSKLYNYEINDTLEPFNRIVYKTYKFSYDYGLYYIINPYTYLPSILRERFSDFASNIQEPFYFANHILQLKPVSAIESLMRFTFNSTVGLLGFIDVMSYLGLQKKENDFGITLAHYGVPNGPYLVILGPRSLRDSFGMLTEFTVGAIVTPSAKYFSKNIQINDYNFTIYPVSNSSTLITVVDYGVFYCEQEETLKSTLDPYVTIRTMSMVVRINQLKTADTWK
jgi:ABC-type transporter lipoprotein component MlaA